MDRAGAITALEQARLLGPTVEGLLDLALAYHLAGDVGAEVSAAEAATVLEPESQSAWSELRPRARAHRPGQRVPRGLRAGARARRRCRGRRPAGARRRPPSRAVAFGAQRGVTPHPSRAGTLHPAARAGGGGRAVARRFADQAIEPSRPHTGHDSPTASGRPPHPGQSSTASSTPSSSPTRQTSSRSSSTSTHDAGRGREHDVVAGPDRHRNPRRSPTSRGPGRPPARSRAGAAAPRSRAGTINPERRTRSGSSSLITTRSNRGLSWLRMSHGS